MIFSQNMKMMKVIFGLLILLFTLPIMAQKDERAKKILDEMSAYYQKMESFRAKFTYTLENPVENINDEFSGEIIVKGNQYRLTLGDQEIINNGQTLWTYLSEVNEVNIDNYEPDEESLTPSKIFTAYQKGYKYLYRNELSEDNKVYDIIDLVPEDQGFEFFKIRMKILKQDNSLASWRIFAKNGSRYVYHIKEFEPNVTINNGFFEFDTKKHQGIEIVDLR